MDAKSLIDIKPNRNIPDFRPGDTVRVHAKVVEGDRERIQVFEGVVIRIRRRGPASSFTVRRVTHGIGVERIFPYYSPLVEKVEVSRVGKVRRAKLYYLRGRIGKRARIRPGERARFEALTAALPPEEPEVEEEEALVEETEAIEEGAELTAEEGAQEASEEPSAEAEAEQPAAQAEEATAEEEAAEPAAEAEEAKEPAAEAEEPEVTDEEAPAEEPAAEPEATVEEEEKPAEPEASTEEEAPSEEPASGEEEEPKE